MQITSILLLSLALAQMVSTNATAQPAKKPVRVGIVGLVHSHVHWILGRVKQNDIEIVGIAEPNRQLAERFLKQHNLPMSLVYPTIEEMLDKTKPEAVTDFGKIVDHLKTVQICAPRGVHVMVEKPLAVSLDHARQMETLAKKHQIHLLTNYETTWYGGNYKAFALINKDKAIGDIRKIVVHDGHEGPKEIGVDKEFLDWLTDPVDNGAGALFDFGCYGANLSTWLFNGQRPQTVTAITQQIKPDIYPKVDDEATIILTYPNAQTVIQASWNWPFSRKDMEVYGQTGYVMTVDGKRMRLRLKADKAEQVAEAPQTLAPAIDPFAFLASVVRNETKSVNDLSSLQVNMVVMEILDAAKRSAKEQKTITLK
ncbi:Gfo/Idh/MocA family protein [Tellurirhabdus bombi]|uniref:Gfo/Idh/MocA family protein n=1 Tax=Tellurirhabdus bombi TaxID=2907205 RepID=UPI001F27E3D1|nr:Gfo/Idh/MocA family oxidoreductase [Tellurirhabdus bombi]